MGDGIIDVQRISTLCATQTAKELQVHDGRLHVRPTARQRLAGQAVLAIVLISVVYGPSYVDLTIGREPAGTAILFATIGSLFGSVFWTFRNRALAKVRIEAEAGTSFLTAPTLSGRRAVALDAISAVRVLPSASRYNTRIPDSIEVADRFGNRLSFRVTDRDSLHQLGDAMTQRINRDAALSATASEILAVTPSRACRDRSDTLVAGALWVPQLAMYLAGGTLIWG